MPWLHSLDRGSPVRRSGLLCAAPKPLLPLLSPVLQTCSRSIHIEHVCWSKKQVADRKGPSRPAPYCGGCGAGGGVCRLCSGCCAGAACAAAKPCELVLGCSASAGLHGQSRQVGGLRGCAAAMHRPRCVLVCCAPGPALHKSVHVQLLEVPYTNAPVKYRGRIVPPRSWSALESQ